MSQEKEYWAQGMERLQEIKDATTRETFGDTERNWLISECQKLYAIAKKSQKKLYSVTAATEAIKEPCPFCKGRDLHIYSEWYEITEATYYVVICLTCKTEGPLAGNLTPRQAVKSWDERRLVTNDVESRLHGAIVAAHKKHGCSSDDCPICEIGSVLPPVNAGVS